MTIISKLQLKTTCRTELQLKTTCRTELQLKTTCRVLSAGQLVAAG
jgi:hypothetical protein